MSLTIAIQRIIDRFVFSPVCYLLSPFRIKSILFKKDVKKILVIKFWALGDSVVLLPTIEALTKEFPNAKIDVLAHKRNRIIFEGQKSVNKIIDFGAFNILKNFRNYDLCIDAEPALSVSAVISFVMSKYRIGFEHGPRKGMYQETIKLKNNQHMVQNYLDFARKLGSKYNTEKLIPLEIPNTDKKSVDDFLRKNGISSSNKLIGLTAGLAESVKYRMWPVERFAELADKLSEKYNAKILFIDSKSNRETIEKIRRIMKNKSTSSVDDFGGLKDVKKATELAKRCDLMISNDSGMMHIAASMRTKTIGLFGPNTPALWAPYGKGNIAIFKPKHGCPYMDNKRRELHSNNLTKEQLTCMDAISVEDVMNAVKRIL